MNPPTTIYISLGSNIDPEMNLRNAIDAIKSTLTDCLVSPVYQSPAVGMQGADFLNAVIGGSTTKSVEETAIWLRELEHRQGRVRTENKFTDRSLDLDLLLYGNQVTEALPNHDITEQAYVLKPLADIAPDVVHPVLKRPITTLASELINTHPNKFSALVQVKLACSE